MNLKQETIRVIKNSGHSISDVAAALIHTDEYSDIVDVWEDVSDIPESFDYDQGSGGQEVFGDILFKDGTWLSRGEYNGSEWWEFNKPPTIEELREEAKKLREQSRYVT